MMPINSNFGSRVYTAGRAVNTNNNTPDTANNSSGARYSFGFNNSGAYCIRRDGQGGKAIYGFLA